MNDFDEIIAALESMLANLKDATREYDIIDPDDMIVRWGLALALARELRDKALEVWLDQVDLAPGNMELTIDKRPGQGNKSTPSILIPESTPSPTPPGQPRSWKRYS